MRGIIHILVLFLFGLLLCWPPVNCPAALASAAEPATHPDTRPEFYVPANLVAAHRREVAVAEARDHVNVVFEDEADVTCGLHGDWYQCVARLKTLGGTVRLRCSATGDGCYAMEPECSR